MSPETPPSPLTIGARRVGPGQPPWVVAEISANHRGRLDDAVALVRAAAAAGVDAVKLQTYTADTMTIPSDRPEFRIGHGTLWDGRTLYDLYREARTPWEWHPRLQEVAAEAGVVLFSTPFDDSAVEFLEDLAVPAYKIASFELVDLDLIRRVAATGKPLIMSTGMAAVTEIGRAVETARHAGNHQIALLQCTSAYPAPVEDANLLTIPDLARRFGVVAGLSDHTLGIAVPVAAIALGAALIEKHVCLARSAGGPDAAFSLEPDELAEMVEAVQVAHRARGTVHYGPTPHDRPNLVFRRSLIVVAPVAAGEPLTAATVRAIRPGHGLEPRFLDQVLGRVAARDLSPGTPLTWEDIDGPPPATDDEGPDVEPS